MEERKGLKPSHHGELNTSSEAWEGGEEALKKRFAELRQEYADDNVAQQQMDVYEWNNEYSKHFMQYVEALISGNSAKIAELDNWFNTNYPDIH